MCQRPPQNSPFPRARVPQILTFWRRTFCNILVPLRRLYLPQRQPETGTMRMPQRYAACRVSQTKFPKPKQDPILLQRELPFLVYATLFTATNIGQSNLPTLLAPHRFRSFLNKPHTQNAPVRATHFTLYYRHLASLHPPVNTHRYSRQIQCSDYQAAARNVAFMRTPCVATYAERYTA